RRRPLFRGHVPSPPECAYAVMPKTGPTTRPDGAATVARPAISPPATPPAAAPQPEGVPPEGPVIGRAASAAETRAARTARTGRGAAGSGYGQCPRRGGRVRGPPRPGGARVAVREPAREAARGARRGPGAGVDHAHQDNWHYPGASAHPNKAFRVSRYGLSVQRSEMRARVPRVSSDVTTGGNGSGEAGEAAPDAGARPAGAAAPTGETTAPAATAPDTGTGPGGEDRPGGENGDGAAARERTGVCALAGCTEPLPPHGRGRPPKYCSKAHADQASRDRR